MHCSCWMASHNTMTTEGIDYSKIPCIVHHWKIRVDSTEFWTEYKLCHYRSVLDVLKE